jgi:hypothetical protein
MKNWCIGLLVVVSLVASEIVSAGRQSGDALGQKGVAVSEGGEKSKGAVIYHTGEMPPTPRSLHPQIERVALPTELRTSIIDYLANNQLDQLDVRQRMAILLALDKCYKLDRLPITLKWMGLEEVALRPSETLTQMCTGYSPDSIMTVTESLMSDARDRDITAIFFLGYILDPGKSGVRIYLENLGSDQSGLADALYAEVSRFSIETIPSGNLYAAKQAAIYLEQRASYGYPWGRSGNKENETADGEALIKSMAYSDAVFAVSGDWKMQSRASHLGRSLSDRDREEAMRLSQELVDGWMNQPALFDTEIPMHNLWSSMMDALL